MDLETELFNKELKCSLIKVVADYDLKMVTLMLCKNHCTDMTGAINFCKRIMPDVRAILTASDQKKNTAYILEKTGWVAGTYDCFT